MAIGRRDLINGWIAITFAASVVALVDGGFTAHWAALDPARIWRGEVWRLVTWIFVEQAPTSILFTCAAIYKFGGEVAPRWGTRRLIRFMIEVVLLAGIAATLLTDHARCGGLVVADVLLISWARQYPNETLTFYGFLHLRGRDLVMMTVGGIALYALAMGPLALVPELVAAVFAALYPRARLARM